MHMINIYIVYTNKYIYIYTCYKSLAEICCYLKILIFPLPLVISLMNSYFSVLYGNKYKNVETPYFIMFVSFIKFSTILIKRKMNNCTSIRMKHTKKFINLFCFVFSVISFVKQKSEELIIL